MIPRDLSRSVMLRCKHLLAGQAARAEPECAACALVHSTIAGVAEAAHEVIAEVTATAAAAALAAVVRRFGRDDGT